MTSDKLQSLRDAGVAVDELTEAQRGVFASLNDDEIAVVQSIQERLNEVEPEVVGQIDKNNNNNLC